MYESLVWIVPLATLVVAVVRPYLGVCLLAASTAYFGTGPGGPYLLALDAAALAAIGCGWRRSTCTRSRLDAPVAALAIISFASLVPPSFHPPSWHPRTLLSLLIALPSAQSFSPLYSGRAFLSLVLGLGLFVVTKRAFSGASLRPLGLAFAASLSVLVSLGLAELAGLVDLHGFRAIGEWIYWTRLHSLYFHAGWLAELLVVAGPVALAALACGGRKSRVAAIVLTMAMLLTLLLTQARGAWFTALAQLAVLLLLHGGVLRERTVRLPMAIVALSFTIAATSAMYLRPELVDPVAERLDLAVADLAGRPMLWDSAIELTRERPLLGWGVGSFASVFEHHWPRLWHPTGAPPGTAHSLYLTVAAERGLLGLAALLLLGAVVFHGLWRRLSHPDREERFMATGFAISTLAIAVYGITQYLPYLEVLELTLWMLLGAIASRLPVADAADARRTPGTIVAMALTAVAVIAASIRAATVSAPTLSEDRAFGFHMPEWNASRVWRWSDGRSARRVPRSSDTLVLELANGHMRPSEHPVTVTLRIDGKVVLEKELSGGWESHSFQIEGDEPTTLIEVTAHPTFRPFIAFRPYIEERGPGDIRRLGVAITEPRWATPQD